LRKDISEKEGQIKALKETEVKKETELTVIRQKYEEL